MFGNKYIIKKRIKSLFVIVGVLLSLLALRLYFIMDKSGEELAAIADAQITIKEPIGELNYNLLDCNGKDLLKYKEKYYFCVISNLFSKNNYNTKLDDLLATNIILKKYNKEYDLINIDVDSFEKVIWEVDEKTYGELKEIEGVKGVYTYSYKEVNDKYRESSIENIITNPIYYKPETNDDGETIYVETKKPQNSLEGEIIKKTLQNGYVNDIFKIDESGAIENVSTEISKENLDVVLTLDEEIQLRIEEVINDEKYKDNKQIGVIVMESDTGKIRGLAQKDYYNDANIILGTGDVTFHPGSIFKIIVEEAGLEEKIIDLNKTYYLVYNDIYDHFDSYPMKITEAFIKSSNNVFSQVGEEVTLNIINEYAEKQGLNEKVLNMCSENNGFYDSNINVGQTSIGQGHGITPIEAISIPNTIINEGKYVKPTIVEGYADSSGNIIEKENIIEKRVISETNANIIKNQMISVVREGTGKKAYSSYIDLGGKTGTAECVDEGDFISIEKDYDDEEFNELWFAGFFEVNNKYYSMIVFIPHSEEKVYGGDVCAPIFKDIVENLYTYLQ